MRGIHRRSVNSPHKRPVTRKMFPFDDVIMKREIQDKRLYGHRMIKRTAFQSPCNWMLVRWQSAVLHLTMPLLTVNDFAFCFCPFVIIVRINVSSRLHWATRLLFVTKWTWRYIAHTSLLRMLFPFRVASMPAVRHDLSGGLPTCL